MTNSKCLTGKHVFNIGTNEFTYETPGVVLLRYNFALSGNTAIHYNTLQHYNTTQYTTIHYNTTHRKGGGVGEPLVPPIDSTKLYSNQIISIQLYIYQPISHLMSRRMD